MSATTTHYLSKEEVSEKLQGVSYSFQESYWESFWESQGTTNAKFVSTKSPSIKFTPKLIAIPLSLVAISAIIYFSITNLRSGNSAKESGKQNGEATMLVQPKENTIVTPKANPTPTVVKQETPVNSNIKTQEQTPLVATPTNNKSAKEVTKNSKKEDSSATDTQTAKEAKNKIAEQASVVTDEKKESTSKKKKKKRNRKKGSENTNLVPSPEEDNVVIPD